MSYQRETLPILSRQSGEGEEMNICQLPIDNLVLHETLHVHDPIRRFLHFQEVRSSMFSLQGTLSPIPHGQAAKGQ